LVRRVLPRNHWDEREQKPSHYSGEEAAHTMSDEEALGIYGQVGGMKQVVEQMDSTLVAT